MLSIELVELLCWVSYIAAGSDPRNLHPVYALVCVTGCSRHRVDMARITSSDQADEAVGQAAGIYRHMINTVLKTVLAAIPRHPATSRRNASRKIVRLNYSRIWRLGLPGPDQQQSLRLDGSVHAQRQ